ncbi:MAG: hypothetical protein EH225_07505, partial [Calditrichaeota bacterium]
KAPLPVAYYYTDTVPEEDLSGSKHRHRCVIANIFYVLEGHPFVYHSRSPGCTGGKRYTGFSRKLHPDFEYFLSCGIPGEIEGERYKKTPDLVKTHLKNNPPFEAPGQYLVFKRWDKLDDSEQPVAVIFFATPDVLSGLFTLANFDRDDSQGVIAPMGAGCASVINYAMDESRKTSPRCILGMFDVSARPHVAPHMLTFTIPIKRFAEMVGNMEESFLIAGSWQQVKRRIRD